MPNLGRIGGYRFFFYSHEPGEPPHVHVSSGTSTGKVWLEPVSLARSRGFAAHDLGVIIKLVRQNREAFLEAWHDHFGSH